ncbi:M66 family metalloprotease [Psychromonas ossibalaenae]|uniref:M66 family metalloprotease n=1 Tax=Psychromonas ossibalaenae TaxID=444922 RepID=UPI00037F1FFC|nr:M66 family metalloprotease [Psychromonas ossibalaenae]
MKINKITTALIIAGLSFNTANASEKDITEILQAEDAIAFGTPVDNSIPGYSGSGYRTGEWIEQGHITFEFNAPVDGEYKLRMRYSSPEERTVYLHRNYQGQFIAGKHVDLVSTQDEENWSYTTEHVVKLQSGKNSFTIGSDGELVPNIDHLEISYMDPNAVFEPVDPIAPVNPVDPIEGPSNPRDEDVSEITDPIVEPGDETIAFFDVPLKNDLTGDFKAQISYAQNITLFQNSSADEPRPHLTANRDTLLMVQPLQTQAGSEIIKVKGFDKDGSFLGGINLTPPEGLPAHDGEDLSIVYAHDMWSATLPSSWIEPGLELKFTYGKDKGELNNIVIGAPTEILIHTIDIGMLVEPRNNFKFADEIENHLDYYQKIPASKLTVNQYEPIHLKHIVMPNGDVFTDYDPSEGGWHKGDMRGAIGKILISHGIDMANYGSNSSIGNKESGHTYLASQIAAHSSRGNYSNGVQIHGGSGGNGMVTIDNSLGNEWSHEVAHNFGIGHFPGGTDGSIHRPAGEINSGWGWDASKQRFIVNFFWDRHGDASCCDDETIPPWQGYQLNKDTMSGGAASSPLSNYTLQTPYNLEMTQKHLEGKINFAAGSPTGFEKWDAESSQMIEYKHLKTNNTYTINNSQEFEKIRDDTDAEHLRSQLDINDRIDIKTRDGAHVRDIYFPTAEPSDEGKVIMVSSTAGYNSKIYYNDAEEQVVTTGNTYYYKALDSLWVEQSEQQILDAAETLIPEQFAVPVTTLVGFYDPQGDIEGYIYPGLHGAYGFVYKPDAMDNSEYSDQCYLEVKFENNSQSHIYELENNRLSEGYMNKLHVNIAQADQPDHAEVICNGKSQGKLDIQPPKNTDKDKKFYSTNGKPWSDTSILLNTASNIKPLENDSNALLLEMNEYQHVTVRSRNGSNILIVDLPMHEVREGQLFTLDSIADQPTTVNYNASSSFVTPKDSKTTWLYTKGGWSIQ